MASALRMRPAVHNLSADQLAVFRSAYAQMQAITDNRSFSYFAHQHGAPNWYCHHGDPLFLPWHRAYLYMLEMTMRDFASDAVLPWWDWTLGPPRQVGIPEAFAAEVVGQKPNPLYSSLIDLPNINPPTEGPTGRDPKPPDELPTQANVDDVMRATDWNDFSGKLEGVHGAVHDWVGGDMGLIALAAFDPIFYSHHAMIDRIWAIWQVRNGNGNVPNDLLDSVLTPFPFKFGDVLSVNALGYDYAAASAVVAGG